MHLNFKPNLMGHFWTFWLFWPIFGYYRVELVLPFHVVLDEGDVMYGLFNYEGRARLLVLIHLARGGHYFREAVVEAIQMALKLVF